MKTNFTGIGSSRLFHFIVGSMFLAFISCQDDFLTEPAPGYQIQYRSTESILTAGTPNDDYGIAVATTGNRMFTGARNTQKVFEYARTGGVYTLINELSPSPATALYGSAISQSGNWLAVGAPVSNTIPGGKVFMYRKQGNTWKQQAILTGPASNANFGGLRCVALQGNTLAVTSIIPGAIAVSTLSIFTFSGNEWTLQQEIVVPGIRHNAVKLDASETRIATAGVLNNNAFFPRALIFVLGESGWALEDEVVINLPGVSGCFDVAIDGNTIVLPAHVTPGNRHFVITNNGGDWEVSQELITPAGQPVGIKYVDIEGQKIVIGASATNNAFADAVHVFENNGSTWDLMETIIPTDLGLNVRIMSIALEGNTIAVGCPGNAGFAGKMYAFE